MIWIIYLFFISTSGGEMGPWPSSAPPWIRHWWTHKRWAVGGQPLEQVSNLAEYTAVWAADSVVGRPRQRTSVVSTHRWLVSNDASWVCRPPMYWATDCAVQPSSLVNATDCRLNVQRCCCLSGTMVLLSHALDYANCIEYDTYSIV